MLFMWSQRVLTKTTSTVMIVVVVVNAGYSAFEEYKVEHLPHENFITNTIMPPANSLVSGSIYNV